MKHSKTIILGDIPAGSRINEKEFSDTLNISRTPIRYAMTQLVAEKLVEHVPKIGIVVKGSVSKMLMRFTISANHWIR